MRYAILTIVLLLFFADSALAQGTSQTVEEILSAQNQILENQSIILQNINTDTEIFEDIAVLNAAQAVGMGFLIGWTIWQRVREAARQRGWIG